MQEHRFVRACVLYGSALLMVMGFSCDLASAQRVLRVPGEYPTIQAAIDAAENRDTVLVADGTYQGPGNAELDFLGKAIAVRSENLHGAELRGGQTAVFFRSGETAEAVLEGFLFRNFRASAIRIENSSPTIRDCRIRSNNNNNDRLGGGVNIRGGAPTFIRCRIEANACRLWDRSAKGGGVYVEDSDVRFVDCEFADNEIEYGDHAEGGGVWIRGGAAEFLRCTFSRNRAEGKYVIGGGVSVQSSDVRFVDCAFIGNNIREIGSCVESGGGAYVRGGSVHFLNCRFEGNSASFGGGASAYGAVFENCAFVGNLAPSNGCDVAGGGGLAARDSLVIDCRFERNESRAGEDAIGGGAEAFATTFLRCIFQENISDPGPWGDSNGGGLHLWGGGSLVADCLFVGNRVLGTGTFSCEGGGVSTDSSSAQDEIIGSTFVGNSAECGRGEAIHASRAPGLVVANSVIWDNGPDPIGGFVEVEYSCVEGGFPGEGNIADDPRFRDPLNGDFRLSDGSPCIDAGDNESIPPESTHDLDGNPRRVDDLGSPNMGRGTPPVVDMGAYEFQGRSTGLRLRVRATCPDGGAARVGWANATPGGEVALLFAPQAGSVAIPPNRPCAGTRLGLAGRGARIVLRTDAGPNGTRILDGAIGPAACGGHTQLIDLTTCATSNVVRIE